jgi:hypothetical protein
MLKPGAGETTPHGDHRDDLKTRRPDRDDALNARIERDDAHPSQPLFRRDPEEPECQAEKRMGRISYRDGVRR